MWVTQDHAYLRLDFGLIFTFHFPFGLPTPMASLFLAPLLWQ